MSLTDGRPWEADGDLPWDVPDAATYCGEDQADGWRGSQHLADWPIEDAGPIYWLLKRDADREGA